MASLSSAPSLSGTLTAVGTLSGGISGGSSLAGVLTVPAVITPEIYDGEYEVTPRASDEVLLDTQGKMLLDDVTVHEIPYYETTNESGGYTAIIG